MLRVDGSLRSGSGTLVRNAVAVSALTGQVLHIYNVRDKRPKPGLRPQHLSAVHACAQMCGAEVEGVLVGSREFVFRPGGLIAGGEYDWDIGTAGSTTLLALSILPLAAFADRAFRATVTGGLFQDFAPSSYHVQHALLPLLGRMGLEVRIAMVRPGYLPAGQGRLEIRVQPVRETLRPIQLLEAGQFETVRGIALSSHLRDRQVSDRVAAACEQELRRAALSAAIERVYDTTANSPGAALAVWAESSTGGIIAADQAGAPRRRSEAIGRFVARRLVGDIAAGATVDQHLADQLVLFAALAGGESTYIIPRQTEHVDSSTWLAEMLGATVRLRDQRLAIDGIAYRRSG
jgi:RNA 3'-terminal phosphate cyclase (ATP)